MTRLHKYVNRESSNSSPKTSRTNPKIINLFTQVFPTSANAASPLSSPIGLKRLFLARSAALSMVPPIPTPTMMGGQGLACASQTQLTTKSSLYPSQSIRRLKHRSATHVFTSTPPCAKRDFELISRNNFPVNDHWSIITGVFPGNRMTDGVAEQSLLITSPHP